MSHEIKGFVIKYDKEWFDKTRFLTTAFSDHPENHKVPVMARMGAHFDKEAVIGEAELLYKNDGVYYVAHLNDTPVASKCIDKILNYDYRFGIFANHIQKEGKVVTAATIRSIDLAHKCDDAAEVTSINGLSIEEYKKKTEIKIEDAIEYLKKKDPEHINNYIDEQFEPDAILGIIKYFYFERLKWCGCGEPTTALQAVSKLLLVFSIDDDDVREDLLMCNFKVRHIWESELLMCLTYVLDAADLTDHGSSINWCWLTQDGVYLLFALLKAESREEGYDI